jgi:hypothetical protein
MEVEVDCGGLMTVVWLDPRSELRSIALRNVTARVLIENDPQKLYKLIEELTAIIEAQLATNPAN